MLLAELVAASAAVAETRSRKQKQERLADLLTRVAPDEVGVALAYLSGEVPGGKTGIGWAAVREARETPAATEAALTLAEVERTIDEVRAARGKGSAARRREGLARLMARATPAEADFLARLLVGELRQGALEGVMVEAIARAADVPADAVRRAHMRAGDLAEVGRVALAEGVAGLARFQLQLFRPVLPMLAQPVDGVGAALERLGEAALELKLDGARVQVHKQDDEVRVFSRRLNEVTAAVPELIEAARALPARSAILDGEVLALRPDGSPQPFQVTMRRFGRRLDVDAMRAELPLSTRFFDCLLIDDHDLTTDPTRRRIAALDELVPAGLRVPRLVTASPADAETFWRQALAGGHEGLMAKALDAGYDAGGRGGSWLKIKPAHTLDLVVLAAEWGSGRRKGWLSNLHLGARDPAGGGFVMLGKTFKGLTDAILRWQTDALLARAIGRDCHVVHVRPELVVEIAFSDVQASPHYPGGMALRFARVKRYRDDKQAREADTIDAVREIFSRQHGRAPGTSV